MRKTAPLLLLLAGCAGPESKFEQAWPQLSGQPIDALIARWGDPSNVETRPDHSAIFIWHKKSTIQTTTPVASSGTYGGTPFTVTTNVPTSMSLQCTVRIVVRADGTMHGYRFMGSNGACQELADAL